MSLLRAIVPPRGMSSNPANAEPESEPDTALQEKKDSSRAPPHAVSLEVIEGPQTGKKLVFDGASPSRVLIGQSVVCELNIADPEVSRRHAAVQISEAGVSIKDLSSKNGTYVNGLRVIEAILGGGELLRLGGTVLRVELVRAASELRLS